MRQTTCPKCGSQLVFDESKAPDGKVLCRGCGNVITVCLDSSQAVAPRRARNWVPAARFLLPMAGLALVSAVMVGYFCGRSAQRTSRESDSRSQTPRDAVTRPDVAPIIGTASANHITHQAQAWLRWADDFEKDRSKLLADIRDIAKTTIASASKAPPEIALLDSADAEGNLSILVPALEHREDAIIARLAAFRKAHVAFLELSFESISDTESAAICWRDFVQKFQVMNRLAHQLLVDGDEHSRLQERFNKELAVAVALMPRERENRMTEFGEKTVRCLDTGDYQGFVELMRSAKYPREIKMFPIYRRRLRAWYDLYAASGTARVAREYYDDRAGREADRALDVAQSAFKVVLERFSNRVATITAQVSRDMQSSH